MVVYLTWVFNWNANTHIKNKLTVNPSLEESLEGGRVYFLTHFLSSAAPGGQYLNVSGIKALTFQNSYNF